MTSIELLEEIVARGDGEKELMDALKEMGIKKMGHRQAIVGAVVGKLNDRFCLQIFPSGPLYYNVRDEAWKTLLALPLLVTRDIDFKSHIRGRLLGRIAWYRCRLRLRVRRIALYWYALPYRPSGPGHARDMEAWGRMRAE